MGVGISLIFIVVDLYPYRTDDEGFTIVNGSSGEFNERIWMKKMLMAEDQDAERILDTRVAKHTRGKGIWSFW